MSEIRGQDGYWEDWSRALGTVSPIEEPTQLPSFYVVRPGEPEIDRHRGVPYFELLQAMGFRVNWITPGTSLTMQISSPWTFLHALVPLADVSRDITTLRRGRGAPCCAILDVHYPLMNMEQMATINDPDGAHWLNIVESREVVMGNLRAACAVTVPYVDWVEPLATELGEEKVFHLPVIESVEDVMKFGTRWRDLVSQLMTGMEH